MEKAALVASTQAKKRKQRTVVNRWPTLARLMKERNLDDEALGKLTGTSRFAVRNWRLATKLPRTSRLDDIALALQTDKATLVQDMPHGQKNLS